MLLLIMIFTGAWWLFWPWMVWLLVFAVHFLVVKSLTVKSDWVDERTAETVDHAYDLSHIMSIRKRYDDLSSHNGGKNGPEQDGTAAPTGSPDER